MRTESRWGALVGSQGRPARTPFGPAPYARAPYADGGTHGSWSVTSGDDLKVSKPQELLVVVPAEGGAEGTQSHGCGTNEVLVTVRTALIEPCQCGLDEPTK